MQMLIMSRFFSEVLYTIQDVVNLEGLVTHRTETNNGRIVLKNRLFKKHILIHV